MYTNHVLPKHSFKAFGQERSASPAYPHKVKSNIRRRPGHARRRCAAESPAFQAAFQPIGAWARTSERMCSVKDA